MATPLLSKNQELSTSSESSTTSSSSSSPTSDESEEEGGVRYMNDFDDSEERKCDRVRSGSDEKTACMTHQTGNMTAEQFIPILNDEVKDLRKIIKELEEELSKKDKEVTDKDRLIHTLENKHTLEKGTFESSLKTNKERVRELEEKLNEKDRDITEKNMAITTIENQSKMIQNLQKELNEKDGNIKEKNNAIATLENHLKMVQELEEKLVKKDIEITKKNEEIATLEKKCEMIHNLQRELNEKDGNIKEKNNAIATLENHLKMVQELEEKLVKKDIEITEKNEEIATLEKKCEMIQNLQKELNEKDGNIKEKNNAIATLENHLKMVQKLEEKLDKKDIEITEKNEEIATLEKKCEIEKEEVMKIHTQYDEVIKQNKRVLKEKASEIKRLQKYEENHAALQATLDVLQKKLGNYEATLAKANGKINQLTNELRTAGKEKEELLHRLSKIAGAKLTYNNPNIADLSDQKRPTKLAEEFAELYDNEWTDAFEGVDIERDEDKVAYMLSLLKAAYELCKLASQNHMEKMKSSICKLTVDAKHTSGERHKHPKNKCGEVVFDYQKFQDEQKKAVMELGKFVEIKLSTEFEKIVVDNIASEYCIDKNGRKKLYVYTQKCVNICWSMCRLEIPVVIGLQDVYDGMHLDTSVFKAYTKSGKFVDYIVWPPLYLHENGPLLCKGVAQGKA